MNFSSKDLDAKQLLELLELAPMLDVFKNADGTINVEVVQQLYEALASEYRPILDQVPALVGIVADDIGGIGENFVDSILAVSNSPRAISARTKSMNQRAMVRKQAYDSYIKAGFSVDMAKSLLLTDVANAKIAWSDLMKSTQRATTSAAKLAA